MRKILISLALIAVSFLVWATVYPDAWLVRPKGNQTALIDMLRVKSTMFLPSGTGSPSLGGGKDSTGAVWIEKGNSKLWIYLKSVGWKEYATMAEADSMDGTSGTYTPTASDLQNVTSVSFTNCGTRYIRHGDQVVVYGAAAVVVTSSATLTSFELTLPIESTLTTGNFTDITGVVNGVEQSLGGLVTAENNHAQLLWGNTGMVAGTYNVNYTYSYTVN